MRLCVPYLQQKIHTHTHIAHITTRAENTASIENHSQFSQFQSVHELHEHISVSLVVSCMWHYCNAKTLTHAYTKTTGHFEHTNVSKSNVLTIAFPNVQKSICSWYRTYDFGWCKTHGSMRPLFLFFHDESYAKLRNMHIFLYMIFFAIYIYKMCHFIKCAFIVFFLTSWL